MKLGIALPMFDLETGRPLRRPEMAAVARPAEALGFDSVWAMDHFWLLNVAPRTGGHDPLLSLTYHPEPLRDAFLALRSVVSGPCRRPAAGGQGLGVSLHMLDNEQSGVQHRSKVVPTAVHRRREEGACSQDSLGSDRC
jgi:hypothetical protein